MYPKRLFFLIASLIVVNVLAGDRLWAQRDLFPYRKPYPECPSEYTIVLRYNLEVKGPVKSIVQTSNASIYRILDNKPGSNKMRVKGCQMEYQYDTLGRPTTFVRYEVLVNDTFSFPPLKSNLLPVLQESTSVFTLNKEEECTYHDGLPIREVEGDNRFEYAYDNHRNLSGTYHFMKNRLVAEKHISFNKFDKPVLHEEFVYGYKFSHKDPLKMTNAEKEDFRGIAHGYDYDELGNMVAHKMNNGSVCWMDRYEYDESGNLVSAGRCQDYKGKITSCKCKHYKASFGYEYDQQHRMTREYSIGDWKPEGWDDYYEYDDEGRKTRQYHYDVRQNERTFTRDIRFSYDSMGNLVRKEAVLGQFLSNNSYFGYPVVTEELWQYDEQGNLVLHKIHQANGKDQEIRFQYVYDAYGNWTWKAMFRVYSDGVVEPMETLSRYIEYYE